MTNFHSGFVAIIGRPNTGKSTLLNALLGQKIAAVSPKAQTTRRRQLGILSKDNAQIVFVDTPGLHTPRHKLGEVLNQEAEESLKHVDVILWMVDASDAPGDDDQRIAALLAALRKRPALFVALNKMDLVPPDKFAANSAAFGELVSNADVFAISATKREGLPTLLEALFARLPEREPEYALDQVTDDYERDIAADLIREACLHHLRDEVPHGVNVRIDEFTERGDKGAYIAATLFVERESQKGILIGESGNMLKKIGTAARKEIEAMSGRKVFIELRAKVAKDWRDDESQLRQFGYKLDKLDKKKKKK